MIKKILQLLKRKESNEGDKKWNYIIILICISLLFILLGKSFNSKKETPQMNSIITETDRTMEAKTAEQSSNQYTQSKISEMEKEYEQQLISILEKIQGVTDVEVMVNLDSTDVTIYEKSITSGKQITDETDRNGGKRKVEDVTEDRQVMITRQGDKETPMIVQIKKPEVRGVLVVANGINSVKEKASLIESISKVLQVPTHRISVLSKEN